jgi:protein FrlC
VKISVASSLFVNFSLADTIRLVAQTGCEGIDLWGGRPHLYRKDHGPDELREFRSLILQCGLSPVSFMPAFFRYPHSLSSPKDIVRQDSIQYMYECLDSAVALGAGILLIVPGRSLYGQSLEDAKKRLIDSIYLICQRAHQYDIRLGIEPANTAVTNLVNSAEDALSIIKELGDGNLGIVLDSGHVHLSKEPPEKAVAKAGRHLFQVHINDNDGRRQQNLIPGQGTFDFAGFLDILRKNGYAGFLSIELAWEYSLDPVPAVIESRDRIIQLLQG